jgi:hypothetical protein
MILTSFLGIHLIFPIVIIGNSLIYFSLMEIKEAKGLHEKIQWIANKVKYVRAK